MLLLLSFNPYLIICVCAINIIVVVTVGKSVLDFGILCVDLLISHL